MQTLSKIFLKNDGHYITIMECNSLLSVLPIEWRKIIVNNRGTEIDFDDIFVSSNKLSAKYCQQLNTNQKKNPSFCNEIGWNVKSQYRL